MRGIRAVLACLSDPGASLGRMSDQCRPNRKKDFAVAPTSGTQLAAVVNKFIHLDLKWFDDCYK